MQALAGVLKYIRFIMESSSSCSNFIDKSRNKRSCIQNSKSRTSVSDEDTLLSKSPLPSRVVVDKLDNLAGCPVTTFIRVFSQVTADDVHHEVIIDVHTRLFPPSVLCFGLNRRRPSGEAHQGGWVVD